MNAPFVPGLCSVTFRHLPVAEVVALAAEAGLAAIEWGGDVHVPPGDLDAAAHARDETGAAGLTVASYGSYLTCGHPDEVAHDVGPVLDTAAALGTPLVRVWCPFGVLPAPTNPHATDEPWVAQGRHDVAAALEVACAAAAERDLHLALEFHGGTLTATAESAADLLERVGAANLWCDWQPPYWHPLDDDAEAGSLATLGRRLAHLHVYAWDHDGTRRPLADENDRWRARLAAAVAALTGPAPTAEHADVDADERSASPFARAALLEFVVDDQPRHLAADAATLHALLT